MTYKHRNSLSDGMDGQRDGVGELQFEMNRAASQRYNGFVQFVRSADRIRVEGAKMTSNKEVKSLRTLEGRQKVFSKYWRLFFNNAVTEIITRPEPVIERDAIIETYQPEPVIERDVIIETHTPTAPVKSVLERMEETAARVERRKNTSRDRRPDGVVPRRRSSDWVKSTVDAAGAFEDAPKTAEGGKK